MFEGKCPNYIGESVYIPVSTFMEKDLVGDVTTPIILNI